MNSQITPHQELLNFTMGSHYTDANAAENISLEELV